MVRQKRRYLLVEILPSGITNVAFQFTDTEIYHAILDQVARMHGDYGVGSILTSFHVKVNDQANNTVVIKVAPESCQVVTSSIPFVIALRASKCVLRVLFEGSTMRSVERHLLRAGLEDLYAKLRAATTPGEKSTIRAAIASKTGSQVASVRM